MRFSRMPFLLKALFLVVLVAPLALPMNFVVIQPGEATSLFPKVLKISRGDVTTYPTRGQMYLLSIWVSNPDAKVLGYQVVQCWAQADCVVMPRSVIYQRDTDTKSEIKKSTKQMKASQSTALSAARALVEEKFPNTDITRLQAKDIKVELKNTGGPSGGLIFALGIVELLTSEDLLQGRKVAASGTISATGKVGPIGGIAEKIIAAKKSGATLLFASRGNCDELPTHVSGISVVAISRLADAVAYLENPVNSAPGASGSREVVGCTNLRA